MGKKKNEKANKSAELVENNGTSTSAEQGENKSPPAEKDDGKNGTNVSAERGKKNGPGGIGRSASNEDCWE